MKNLFTVLDVVGILVVKPYIWRLNFKKFQLYAFFSFLLSRLKHYRFHKMSFCR